MNYVRFYKNYFHSVNTNEQIIKAKLDASLSIIKNLF